MRAAGERAPRLGVVVIGRNEGERLRTCLSSLRAPGRRMVYVDSGSGDGSQALAAQLGAEVLELDLTRPFTAARARNAGWRHLLAAENGPDYVQFVDGDCEVHPGWIDTARAFLDAHPDVAVVCGRRRERYPERSVYNLLCDLEWNTPVGEARACGGDAMMRAAALAAADGYRDDLIAGEEPELCVRLRAMGWHIWRLDAEMTLHDAAMLRFSQWWRRTLRAGYAFAEGAALHGAPPERHWVRESRSAWLWGAGMPLAVLVASIGLGAAGLWLLAIYPAQCLRLFLRGSGDVGTRAARAFFLVLGKFPEALGQAKYLAGRLRGRRSMLIEYK